MFSDSLIYFECLLLNERRSTVFRDMLTNPHINKPSDKPIPLDATAPDATLLLDYMQNRDVSSRMDAHQAKRLVKLCDQLGCDIVVERMLLYLWVHVRKRPLADLLLGISPR